MVDNYTPDLTQYEEVTDNTPDLTQYEEVTETAELPEIKKERQNIDEPTQSRAALLGAGSGATAGFLDEIVGMGAAGIDYIRELMAPTEHEQMLKDLELRNKLMAEESGQEYEPQTGLKQKYQDFRDIVRAETKAAEEAHGGTFMAAELTGGIVPGLATGGGAVGAGLLKGGVKEVLKAGGKEAAKAAMRKEAIKQGAKAGAKFGALEGLGRSEGETISEDVEAALTGAATGGVLGGAVPMAGQAVGGVSKRVLDFLEDQGPKGIKNTMEGFRRGLQGIKTQGKTAQKENIKSLKETVDSLDKFIEEDALKSSGNIINKSLNNELRIDQSEFLEETIEGVQNAMRDFSPKEVEYGKLEGVLKKLQNTQEKFVRSGATFDPKLQSRQKAFEKLDKLRKKMIFEAEEGVDEAVAVNNLFDRAVRMGQNIEISAPEISRIRHDFLLPDDLSALQMIKDVAKLKIKKPTVGPDGKLINVPKELRTVIKRAKPGEIFEKDGRLAFRHSGGKIAQEEFQSKDVFDVAKLSPQETYDLSKHIRSVAASTGGKSGALLEKQGKKLRTDLEKNLREKLGDKVADDFVRGMKVRNEIFKLRKITPSAKELGSKSGQNREALNIGLSQKFQDMHKLGGKTGENAELMYDGFLDHLNKIDTKKAGELKEAVDSYARGIELNRLGNETSFLGKGIISPGGAMQKLAGATGTGIRAINDVTKLPDVLLDKMAETAKGSSPRLGDFFEKLLRAKDQRARNAIFFVATQRSGLKKELEEFIGGFNDGIKEEE